MNWINVKDKLPEEGEIVVVWNNAKYGQNWLEAYLENNEWFLLQEEEFGYTILTNVTHWFLPTKPE
jgi:hypothetical protein